MINSTQHPVSIERVEILIDSYGSNTKCWPDNERETAVALMERTPALLDRYQQAQQLDDVLLDMQAEEQPNEVLLARIVENLPPQQLTSKKIIGQGHRYQWLAGIAASFMAIAILVTVVNTSQQGIQNEQLALQDMDYLLWQDVTGQVSFDNAEEMPTDFMNML